jgi:hypothetical protein
VITEKTQRAIPKPKKKTPQEIGTEAPKHHLPFIERKKPHTQRSQIQRKKTANRKP